LFTNFNSTQPENSGLGKSLAVCYLDCVVAVSLAMEYFAEDEYLHVMI
jgi:hypothetical protein